MPRTRNSNLQVKYQNIRKAQLYKQHQKKYYDVIHALMESFSENNTSNEILVPLTSKIQMQEEELQSKSFIMMGPGHCGKTSIIKWLMRNEQKDIIWIDCRIYLTDSAIITQMLQSLSFHLSRHLSKDLVVKGDINFRQLNRVLQKENKRFSIILKNPQKLAQQTRPLLIYNLLEWINYNSDNENLQFILVTRDIGFVDRGQKRVKSRMNIPLVYIGRPTPSKIKQILVKRIQYGFNSFPNYNHRQVHQSRLIASLQQKQIDKILNYHYEGQMHPISYYLKIMQLVFAIGIQSLQNLHCIAQNLKLVNEAVLQGFQNYHVYITDHKVIARNFFKISHLPEIILMGLFRNRFRRQQQGNYTCSITLGELMKDFNYIKSRVKIEEGGSSFLYSQNIMQGALRNLIDWCFIAFAKSSERIGIFGRQITSRYGPQDIQNFYKQCEGIPNIVKAIYNDSY